MWISGCGERSKHIREIQYSRNFEPSSERLTMSVYSRGKIVRELLEVR